jgi:hypothetical protein
MSHDSEKVRAVSAQYLAVCVTDGGDLDPHKAFAQPGTASTRRHSARDRPLVIPRKTGALPIEYNGSHVLSFQVHSDRANRCRPDVAPRHPDAAADNRYFFKFIVL